MPGRSAGPFAALAAAAMTALPAWAASERWEATSRTAMSITGDIEFSDERITFQNGKALAPVPQFLVMDVRIAGWKQAVFVYRVVEPEDPELLGGNRLCGSGPPVTFLAVSKPVVQDGARRRLAVFTGDAEPLDFGAACAEYLYDPGAGR
ncbi:hypothetical protein [Methylobacterium sp. JK268]